jgi:hypothetical protein
VYACVQQYQLRGGGTWALEKSDIPESQQQRLHFSETPQNTLYLTQKSRYPERTLKHNQ